MKTIHLDGKAVKVTKNLESFLEHARVSFFGLSLWIDALCIDQQSVEERNHQVMLMGTTYSNARKVIVWLGHGNRAISQLFCRLDRTNGSPLAAGGPQDLQLLIEAVFAVVSFRYWSRLWITQELLLARSILLVYGHDSLAWDDLWLGVDELIPEPPQAIKASTAQKHREQRAILKSSKERALRDISELIHEYSSAECTDIKDRVIGIRSLVKDGDKFAPSYGWDAPELALQTVVHFQGGLELLAGLHRCLWPNTPRVGSGRTGNPMAVY
ncbi:hypothetical protein LTR70_009558 [Exophiala xenobiotica]|uniref:Heterokaryon incompatibility domain-containing protein n=1 Tax=Lithohypha guttulata TaxID=1690604 RepID=A0ABR0JWX0_9EURO|nr:hypothetical protein LTR24_009448 [Lithohypha guttulata]KAK5310339.1 hypothetical protein LTR70_009558 [Exophiala xenobiotica]